jgi:hypothetical protein
MADDELPLPEPKRLRHRTNRRSLHYQHPPLRDGQIPRLNSIKWGIPQVPIHPPKVQTRPRTCGKCSPSS